MRSKEVCFFFFIKEVTERLYADQYDPKREKT